MTRLPDFHAAKWDEPLVMELGRPGGRGQLFPAPEPEVAKAAGDAPVPAEMARGDRAMGYGNLVWALINTREFLFIQ